MAKAQNISANTGRSIEKKKKKQQEFVKNVAKKAADVEKRVSSKDPNKRAASSNPRSRAAGTKAKESSNPRAKRSSYNYKPVTVKRPSKSEPFKASDISGSTGRGVSKQARKQTKASYTTAAKHKAQAKQKESDIKAGKFNVPNRLSKDEQMMLSKEGRNAVNYYKNEWEKAKARGDKAGMQKAHEEAEKVRLKNPATVRTYTPDGPTRGQATAIALQQYAQAMAVGDKAGME
jgi:hypothetical protein